MQLEEKRACPSCGADNPVSSKFCWQCYVPFQPPAPLMPAAPPNGGSVIAARPGMAPQGPSPMPMPAPESSSSGPVSTITKLVVGALAAAVGYFGVQSFLGSSVEMPASIAGSPRMTDAAAKEFETSTINEAKDWDLDVQAGVYGSAAPEIFLILIDDAAIETTDQLFDSLTMGMSEAGATVGEDDVLSGEHNGSEYRCIGVSGNGLDASACMWRSDANVGIILDVTRGLDEIEPVLFETHDAAVS